MTRSLHNRYRWFRRQGVGGVVGHDAATCLTLARAEETASILGWETVMESESEPWDGECPAPEYCLCVSLVRPCPDHGTDCRHAETLASLGMVGVNSMADPYLRIVAAELAADVCADPHANLGECAR